MSDIHLQGAVEITCPCGRTVAVGQDEQGTPVILHALPTCSDYMDRDPLDYVRWLNKTIRRRPVA